MAPGPRSDPVEPGRGAAPLRADSQVKNLPPLPVVGGGGRPSWLTLRGGSPTEPGKSPPSTGGWTGTTP
jgi:hypothetical protein